MTTARGLRNNNPGNIRAVAGMHWQGQTSADDAGFCIFDTADNGLRALCKLLISYQEKHGLNTIRGIINRWAPPVENNTGAYVTAVANAIGVSPDAAISMRVAATLSGTCAAIVRHENGAQPYPLPTIQKAAMIAMGLAPDVAPTPVPPMVTPSPVPSPAPSTPSPPVAPQPAPSPRLPSEELTDVPAEEVDAIIRSFKAEGAKVVTKTRQSNGFYTIRAEF